MKEYAESFYKSKAWQKCRKAYMKSVGGLCEICAKEGYVVPGEIVHHINHISPENIQDPEVLLSFSNLQLVCRKHHSMLHKEKNILQRYFIDKEGRVIPK